MYLSLTHTIPGTVGTQGGATGEVPAAATGDQERAPGGSGGAATGN